jgi:large subunit ribosomal protein L7/L12
MADEKTQETKLDSKLQKIIDSVSELSVLELSELVKALEDTFGVQAIAAAPAAAAPAGEGQAAAEEKDSFTVSLTAAGSQKINVIKALREIKPDLGLKEAKDMTEKLPADVLVDAKKEEAEEAKKKLEEAGATVELK